MVYSVLLLTPIVMAQMLCLVACVVALVALMYARFVLVFLDWDAPMTALAEWSAIVVPNQKGFAAKKFLRDAIAVNIAGSRYSPCFPVEESQEVASPAQVGVNHYFFAVLHLAVDEE